MSAAEVTCPSCGAPRRMVNPGITMFVCEYCGRAIYWSAENVLAAGERAALSEGFTRLYRGAAGELHGQGRFVAAGRIRYSFGRGFWDEWYLRLDGGGTAWLTEDNHELCLEREVRAEVPKFGSFDRVMVEGMVFRVEETGEAVCLGAEGELPQVTLPGERYQFVDASSPDGKHALGIEYASNPPAVFVGDWLAPGAVKLDDEGEGW